MLTLKKGKILSNAEPKKRPDHSGMEMNTHEYIRISIVYRPKMGSFFLIAKCNLEVNVGRWLTYLNNECCHFSRHRVSKLSP